MSTKRTRLLVVEDDPGLQRQLKWALDGFEVDCAGTREEAIVALRRHEPAIVLQDLGLPPDPNGVEEGFATIAEIQRLAPRAKIIIVTGREGREHALRAIKLGAYDFCQKPVDAQMLSLIIDRAHRIHQLEIENQRLRSLLDKLSEHRHTAHVQSPTVKLPRQDFGSSQASAEAVV